MALSSPCKVNGVNCSDRSIEPNCHSYCEKYLAYKAEIDKAHSDKRGYSAIYEFDRDSHARIDKLMRRYNR